MATADDRSDPALEWDPETARTSLNATVVAASEPVTAPHDLRQLAVGIEIATARDEACRNCYGEGQRDAVGAFALTFRENGLDEEEIKNILLRVEGKLTRL